MYGADDVSLQLDRCVRWIDGDDSAIGGWLTAVSMEWRRRGKAEASEERVSSFLREWIRIKRVYQ